MKRRGFYTEKRGDHTRIKITDRGIVRDRIPREVAAEMEIELNALLAKWDMRIEESRKKRIKTDEQVELKL